MKKKIIDIINNLNTAHFIVYRSPQYRLNMRGLWILRGVSFTDPAWVQSRRWRIYFDDVSGSFRRKVCGNTQLNSILPLFHNHPQVSQYMFVIKSTSNSHLFSRDLLLIGKKELSHFIVMVFVFNLFRLLFFHFTRWIIENL